MSRHENTNDYGQYGGGVGAMDLFDALPKPLREFLANFPHKAGEYSLAIQLARGTPATSILAQAIQYAEDALPKMSRQTYGEDYPCQPYSSLIASPVCNGTRRSRGSGARSARAARRFMRVSKTWPAPDSKHI